MTISKSEFLGLVKAESAARKSTAVLIEKENLRNELESQLEKFLANGGEIKQLKGTEFKSLPPRSIAEESRFITRSQFNSLFEWCKKGNPRRSRRSAIAERTGLSKSRVFACLTPTLLINSQNANTRKLERFYKTLKMRKWSGKLGVWREPITFKTQ